MADMGFLPCVRRIVGRDVARAPRHVVLCHDGSRRRVPRPGVHPRRRRPRRGGRRSAQRRRPLLLARAARDRRPDITADIIEEYERAIVFTRTKHGADRLARQLGERGISAVPLHGDRTQAQRDRALRSVKNGQAQVLVATDVAARGIHIEVLPVVVHYDPPAQATDYLHRSGPHRTSGRYGRGHLARRRGRHLPGEALQRALGISPSIEPREDAPAIRLGVVDDAVAAERSTRRALDVDPQRHAAVRAAPQRPIATRLRTYAYAPRERRRARTTRAHLDARSERSGSVETPASRA